MKLLQSKKISFILSIFLLILILVIAIYNIEKLVWVMRRTELTWVGLGLGCYFLNYLTRAFRLRMLFQERGSFFYAVIKSSCLHGFYSYFLPLRSGELSLPLLLQYNTGLPLMQGARILLQARLLDLFALGVFLFFASIFAASQLQIFVRGIFLLSGVGLIVLPYGVVFLLKIGKNKWLKFLTNQAGAIEISYPLLKEVLISLLVWFWTGCMVFCVIKSLSIPLVFMDVWFFAAIQLPLQMFPMQGLANAGNHEVGWLAALSLLGIAPAEGLSLSMASHVIFICYVTVLGCFTLMLPSSRSTANSKNLRKS